MSSRRRSTVDPTSQLELALDAADTPNDPSSRRPRSARARPAKAAPREAAAKPAPAAPARRPTVRPQQAVPRFLVTRKEAAASLGMSIDTFERRVQPIIKLVPCGQLVLVPLRELERWCDEHAHHFAGAG
jgi:hypothetical protein